MDQELQFLINTLYGNKLNEKQLSNILQMALSNPQYLDLMRNAARAKMPAGNMVINPVAKQKAMNEIGTPNIGTNNFKFDKNAGRAKNDMSAIDDFKLAFRLARQAGHKTFFWKKTKANPSGMFNTNLKTSSYDSSPVINNTRMFADTDKTDLPTLTGNPPESMLPDTNIPIIPRQGTTDLPIFTGGFPEISVGQITGNTSRIAGRKYGEGQKNANLYFGRKGMFANGGNIQGQSNTPLIGNSGASVADIITIINSKDMNAIKELYSSIGLEGFERAIKGIQQMAEAGDGSALLALQTLLGLMLGSQKAKLGTKLAYIQKLKGVCPEGTEKVYLAKGGCMCAQKGSKGIEKNDTIHHNKQVYDLTGKHKQFKKLTNKDYRNLPTEKQASVDNKDMMRAKDAEKKACGGKTKKKK